MVRKTLLKYVAIPFGVVSTSFLFNGFNQAYAATTDSSTLITLKDFFLRKEGVITKIFKDGDESNIDALVDFFQVWITIGKGIINVFEWFNHLPQNVAHLSALLFTKIYELLMLVLQTPLFIFNNSYIKDTSLVFAGISVLIVVILSMIQGKKRMLKMKNTGFKKILGRFFVSIIGAGAAPFIFEKVFELINMIVEAITKIGSFGISTHKYTTTLISPNPYDWFNTIALLGFDFMLIGLAIPIFLQNGRRFFDLMCLSALTPLSLTAWIFDDTRHLHHQWWSNVKKLSMTPLIYAIFICLLGVFIFGTQNIVSGGGLFLKVLIIIGGLARMANPPNFIKSRVDNGGDVEDSVWNVFNAFKDTYDTVTLKKMRSTKLIKDKISKGKASKLQKIKDLRKKHGRRYVKNLV